ncbi:hypothetical protein QA596_06885 [Balneolales bacterium ANBcel1]|nr:hypothetical protein [Balneolales bacterium ANBcel1]
MILFRTRWRNTITRTTRREQVVAHQRLWSARRLNSITLSTQT